MKLRKIILSCLLLLPALLFSACATTEVADANYAAGRLFASIELGNATPATATATVNNLVAALKSIASTNSVPTPYQMGVLSGQLQTLKAAGATNPSSAITDVASAVDTAVQLYKNSAGANPTLVTAANAAIIQDFINGIIDEQAFLAGQASAGVTTTTSVIQQP